MILADFHMHSSQSADSDTPMERQIEAAIDKGLKHICLTEHMDRDYVIGEDGLDFILDTDSYYKKYLECRAKYEGIIKIGFGVEYGLQKHLYSDLEEYSGKYPFDFIIGSSHICNGKDPYYPSYFEGREEKSAYLEYFECELLNAQLFNDFDVYGHLDYVVRYGPNKNLNYNYNEYCEVLDEILRTLIKKDKGIEINTGGYKSGIGNTNPSIEIIRRYKELGGEIITIGADAHSPEYVGLCFDKAEEILKAAGFEYYTVFNNRKPEFIKI